MHRIPIVRDTFSCRGAELITLNDTWLLSCNVSFVHTMASDQSSRLLPQDRRVAGAR